MQNLHDKSDDYDTIFKYDRIFRIQIDSFHLTDRFLYPWKNNVLTNNSRQSAPRMNHANSTGSPLFTFSIYHQLETSKLSAGDWELIEK